jgi:hypothetical protein
MRLLIDPPVTSLSPVDAIRDWIVELVAMRKQYREDPEALEDIARSERIAADMYIAAIARSSEQEQWPR